MLRMTSLLVAALTLPAVEGLPRPNVVIIYSDDQARSALGCYGQHALTPHADRLAREGVVGERYYATSPVCSPSRYCLLSGRYPSRSHLLQESDPVGSPLKIGWESGIAGEFGTLPAVMRDAGYATAMVGKWHQHGADLIGLPIKARLNEPDVQRILKENYQQAQATIMKSGFTWADGIYWENITFGHEAQNLTTWWLPVELRHHNPEWVTSCALRFLDEHHAQRPDQPFLLYIAPTIPHSPNPFDDLKTANPRVTPLGLLERAPGVAEARKALLQRCATAKLPEKAVESAWLDQQVGPILERLDTLGLTANTLVIYASDNGPPPGKFSTYELGARLPLIMRWPQGLPAGKRTAALASTIDLAPTIYAACSIPPPPSAVPDGRDLLPVLRGNAPGQHAIMLEVACCRAMIDEDGFKYMAVRQTPTIQAEVDAGAKYTWWGLKADGTEHHTYGADKAWPHYFDKDQLYDLEKDPQERNNLADQADQRYRIDALKAILTTISATLPHTFGEFTPGR